MLMMVAASPFGWIGGFLSEISRNLPFTLNMTLLATGVVLTLLYYHKNTDHSV